MFVRWLDSNSDEGIPCCSCACSATLSLTVLVTACSTVLLVAAVVTDHWEHVAWDRARVEHALRGNASHHWHLDWLLDGQVARLLKRRPRQAPTTAAVVAAATATSIPATTRATKDPPRPVGVQPPIFLLPMNGGIWTLCTAVDDEQRGLLRAAGLSQPPCVNYLSASRAQGHDARPSWQHRMQNLSISCALVCLIILGSSAVVGAFGVLMHQASAVLVTGVLYFLAGTFALFTLTIIHFKRAQSPAALGRGSGALAVDGVLPGDSVGGRVPVALPPPPLWGHLMAARRVDTSWSLQLGWGGVAAALLTALLWLALSRAMRGPPPP